MGAPTFRHEVLDADPPGSQHDVTLLADLTGNGLPDLIIGGKGSGGLHGDSTLFWYENPGWKRHDIGGAPNLEPCGLMHDVDGDGRLDIIVGQDYQGTDMFWFQQPPDPRQPWPPHLIEDRFHRYHDEAVGDVDGDGEPELVIMSQDSGILGYYDFPANPAAGPWHDCFHEIAQISNADEGLVIADLDRSGRKAIIAGTNIYRSLARQAACCEGGWDVQPIAPGMTQTRCAVADLNGDGWPDIVLCEGESVTGTLVWFAGPRWRPTLLAEGLDNPHSLMIADFNGDGLPDIMVGEMGLGGAHPPRMMVYLNRGGGEFEEHVITEGIATHEAKVADLNGNGRPDIIGKAYQERHVDIWWNEA